MWEIKIAFYLFEVFTNFTVKTLTEIVFITRLNIVELLIKISFIKFELENKPQIKFSQDNYGAKNEM